MGRENVELKDRVFDLIEISPLDKELLFLKSANLSDSQIAEKILLTEEEIEERKDKHLRHIEALNLEYIGDLSKLSWRQVEDINTFDFTGLSAVAEKVLSYDNRVISSSEMSKVVNEDYELDMRATETGKKLRMLGEEVLEKEEYRDNYLRESSNGQWNIGYLRDNYRSNLLTLIDENKSRDNHRFDLDNGEEIDVNEDEVTDAYDHSIPENIGEKSVEDLYDCVVSDNPDIESLNRHLKNESSGTVLQVSKITENGGGWAPDAENPYKVEVKKDEFYGKMAIIKRSGPTIPYSIERVIDEELE